MDNLTIKKPKVVFALVEAGLGHIMPLTAVANAFEAKYGDKCEVVRTKFFSDTQNPDMKWVEDELVKEVKLHNKDWWRGISQFAMMGLVGTRLSLKFLYKTKYKRGFAPSIEYMQNLNADLIVNTHFATIFYACEAKEKGLINSDIAVYCPDPVIGKQWDNRANITAVSSEMGKNNAQKGGRFDASQLVRIPFLIRPEIANYTENKAFYRKELGIPEDNFTILLADGAYGAGKLEKTVQLLMQSKKKFTIIAVCGRNQKLYERFLEIVPPENITFLPFGFCDKMLTLSAACDLFIGKAGASNLAEPTYFGAPAIITFCATPIETWIAKKYTDDVGNSLKIKNLKKVANLVDEWIENPILMQPYIDACKPEQRHDGAEIYADILAKRLGLL